MLQADFKFESDQRNTLFRSKTSFFKKKYFFSKFDIYEQNFS